jgi:hypothetical protein
VKIKLGEKNTNYLRQEGSVKILQSKENENELSKKNFDGTCTNVGQRKSYGDSWCRPVLEGGGRAYAPFQIDFILGFYV